jgi:uncharacterized membrane protein YfbV (UPF0208 family)
MNVDSSGNPVKQLQQKLIRDTRAQVRERYFTVRILPMLVMWALLWASVTCLLADAISLAVAIIAFCGVTVGIVVWLDQRAVDAADAG